MKRIALALLTVSTLIAAAPPSQRQVLAAAAPFIEKANDEWTRAIVTGDADVLSAPYETNGIFIGPDGSEVRGKDGVRAMYAKPRGDLKIIKASIHSDGRVAHDGDDVYEWGTAMMTVQKGDKIRKASGRYLTVWHRDGKRWLISHNIAF